MGNPQCLISNCRFNYDGECQHGSPDLAAAVGIKTYYDDAGYPIMSCTSAEPDE